MNASLELALKLIQAKSIQEAMQLQAEFTRTQFVAIQAQAEEVGSVV